VREEEKTEGGEITIDEKELKPSRNMRKSKRNTYAWGPSF
jgi:hypothetical protein